MQDVEIRVATAADVREFYPDGPPRTVHAWLASYKGKPACLAGVILDRNGAVAFSDLKSGIIAPKITIWKTAVTLLKLIQGLQLPVITGVEGKRSKFLERLGFEPTRRNGPWQMYKCHSLMENE